MCCNDFLQPFCTYLESVFQQLLDVTLTLMIPSITKLSEILYIFCHMFHMIISNPKGVV